MEDLAIYEAGKDMAIAREPEVVLAEAKKAAQSLQNVVSKKHKPVIFNGEQYLEFEDWQTVGRFYGVTAKVILTEFVDFGAASGFLARAVAIRSDGMEISAAEAMCLNDEPNWSRKPLFQLRSMSQTRACAKALRNVLAWVVVLAGYKPTPAEEMTGNEQGKKEPPKQPQAKSEQHEIKDPDAPITEPQLKAINTLYKKAGYDEKLIHAYCSEKVFENGIVIESLKSLTKGQASKIIDALNIEVNSKNA
jgi:hypothetical protein